MFFPNIPFVKASYKTTPNSEIKAVDFTATWKELQEHHKGGGKRQGKNPLVICATYLRQPMSFLYYRKEC